MKRDQQAMRLEARWRELHHAFQGLSHDALLEPGVVGPWSIRDVLVHVATWEEEAMKALPVILDSGPLPRYSTFYGGIDAFNAQAQECGRQLSRWSRSFRRLRTLTTGSYPT